MALQVDQPVLDFINEPHFGVLATTDNDNASQQTVIWYILDGDEIVINSENSSAKVRHLRDNPEASLCLNANFRYVTISGQARIDDEPNPRLQMAIYSRYLTPEQLQQMNQQQEGQPSGKRIQIRIKVAKVLAWGFQHNFSLQRYEQQG